MIEITRGKSTHVYRLNPTDPRTIERRINRHNARWYFYARRDTVAETRAALLEIERDGQEGMP